MTKGVRGLPELGLTVGDTLKECRWNSEISFFTRQGVIWGSETFGLDASATVAPADGIGVSRARVGVAHDKSFSTQESVKCHRFLILRVRDPLYKLKMLGPHGDTRKRDETRLEATIACSRGRQSQSRLPPATAYTIAFAPLNTTPTCGPHLPP